MELLLEPKKKKISFEPGIPLREILMEQGIFFPHPCGGRGSCGQCRVRFRSGAPNPTVVEQEKLSKEQLAEGIRLSCVTQPPDGSVIELVGSQENQFVFVLGEQAVLPVKIEPEVRKLTFQLPLPTIEDQSDYLSRITGQLLLNGVTFEALIPQVSPDLLSRIPQAAQAENGLVTVTYDRKGIVEIESGDTRERFFGIAIDIGTTTLASRLLDLNTGEVVSQDNRLNSQSSIGTDVINRIEYCRDNHAGLDTLQARILEDLHAMVKNMLSIAPIPPESIAQIACMGNPTMIHLLLGVNPLSIALSPYTPVWTRSVRIPAEKLGFRLAAGCQMIIGPAASAYLGSDVLAGVMASGMDQDEKISLLIDVGTNGEMVLGNREKMLAASTAAGPAFEGATISCGTWAAPGAIDQATLGEKVAIHTLQEKSPIGICGTGLVDLTAELLKLGIVTPMGKMQGPGEIDHLPAAVAERLNRLNNLPAFYLAGSPKAPLYLTAQDIRQVQLAKGAIQAGIAILMSEMGLKPGDIERVYLAGSFGQKLRVSNLQRLGLLSEIEPSRIQAIGNSSLAGAQLTLLSREHAERLEDLHHAIHYIELSSYPGFTEVFTESMLFPVHFSLSERQGL